MVMLSQGKKMVALLKDYFFGGEMRDVYCGGNCERDQRQQQQLQPGKDVVLDHIILDLTGKSLPLEQIADAATQRAFRRKKRLLRHSNTVLFSRLGIMALVTIMLAVTTLLTWYFTSTESSRSIKSLAGVLRQELVQTSVEAMSYTLGEVYNATVVLSSLQKQMYFAASNNSWESVEPELRRVNKGVFDAQPQYTSVAFISQDGRVTDYSRSNTSEYFFFVNSTYTQSPTPVWYWQNLTGFANMTPAVLRQPPYPLSAENLLTKKPSELYWTMTPNIWGQATVSPAVPANDIKTNNLLGLATITSTFQRLNNYLATMDLLDGFIYFQWHNGTNNSAIIASSFNSASDIISNPQNASNPVVRAAAVFLDSTYGYAIMSVNETHSDDINLLGDKYYIDSVPLLQPPYSVLNLTAVMIVPRKSIMGRIDERNHTVVNVSISASVGVLVLGCCLIYFVTSKMSIEMQLRQELIRVLVGKHRAEQSSNYKSQFLANMSHELRTPIAAITGLLDLISCDSLTTDQELSVSQIRSCATGLLALVNNVLDISKVEAGRMELEIAPFSVTDELESLVDLFAVQSVGSNIDVVLDLSDDIPPTVNGDATRIRQIFNNLLSNSMKFTTHGHVLVRGWVDQSLLERDEKHTDFSMSMLSRRDKSSGPLLMGVEDRVALVFEVHDTGCGIPVELRETVFDSFVQADSSTTRTHGGSGLGLYIVKSLVELMGGEVAIVPIEGPGTLMRFHIIVGRALDPSIAARVSGEDHGFSSCSELDWVDYGLGPLLDPTEPRKRPSSKVLERSQVLVAMQEGAAKKAAVQWLEGNGPKVTSVGSWEAIIPALKDMLRNYSTDVGNHVPGVGIDPCNHVNSLEEKGGVSENMTDFAKLPLVLALVDVTMHPSMKIGFDDKFVDHSVFGSRLSRSDHEKLPPPMQDILDCMLKIHSKHSVAVGWIVAPDCGVIWKQALQADGRFLVTKKPLFGRRLKRLLDLLSNTGELQQHPEEIQSSESGSPSTPRLRAMGKPNSDEISTVSCAKDFGEHSRENFGTSSDNSTYSIPASIDGELMYHMAEKRSEDGGRQVLLPDARGHTKILSSSGDYGVLSVIVDIPYDTRETQIVISASVPESPTTAPSTPEGMANGFKAEMEHSTENVAQEVQRNQIDARDMEEDRKKPVMDLRLLGKAQLEESKVARGPPSNAESQSSDEETFTLPLVSKSVEQPPALVETKTNSKSSHENMAPVSNSNFTASNSIAAFGTRALANLHILLVEDTPVLQRLASMMLKKLGANVTVVGDGQQAIIAVAKAVEASQSVPTTLDCTSQFDLILMDCAMPVMDGYDATKVIRAAEENTNRHIPIVALTAHALASDEERCLSVGMDAYLTKPINCKLMVATIQGLVVKIGE